MVHWTLEQSFTVHIYDTHYTARREQRFSIYCQLIRQSWKPCCNNDRSRNNSGRDPNIWLFPPYANNSNNSYDWSSCNERCSTSDWLLFIKCADKCIILMHLSAALAKILSNKLGLNYIFGKMTSHLTHVTSCLLQEILMICLHNSRNSNTDPCRL